MADYGFYSEFHEILNGREITYSFFRKIYSLVEATVDSFHKERLKEWMISGDDDLIRDIGNDFVANYLFEKNNERVRYVFRQLDKTDNVDGLMVTFFKQYVYHFMVRRNPLQTNIRRRIRDILRTDEEKGRIRRSAKENWVVYRRTAAPAGSHCRITEDDLREDSNRFPAWERLFYNQEKKYSPVISNEQLREQLDHMFDHFSGWIPERVILSFFCWHLDIPEYTKIYFDRIEELAADEITPYDKAKLIRNYEDLTDRQRVTFDNHYLNDRKPDEIASGMSLKKSTIYQELRTIRDMFRKDS